MAELLLIGKTLPYSSRANIVYRCFTNKNIWAGERTNDNPKRRDILWADLGIFPDNFGRFRVEVRPVIVVSNNKPIRLIAVFR